MKRVGLIGEDPYDKLSIKNLIAPIYSKNIIFTPLMRSIRGGGLDNVKLQRALKVEIKNTQLDFIIFIRDLDALPSQNAEINKRVDWFKKLTSFKNDILLLNIWELETLIYADIETFNKEYGVAVKFTGNPMMINDPKGKLRHETRNVKKKFHESDCPELFKLLNINLLIKNCIYFAAFIKELSAKSA
ncbi:hypothetical protein OQZ33_17225 [Pedobacter sp. MC2016-05]|uniref:DUF4276 family protein n=1 Tax=Pedobacter sp. MC2016-05 TaxID=2994474 RepID=UPI002245478E|nr:DUF4276 family protein [Pedobacter sp. MC2016-05]MCX2476079.1 hypothetical protein [Pedobacter sp. MC2016-05]